MRRWAWYRELSLLVIESERCESRGGTSAGGAIQAVGEISRKTRIDGYSDMRIPCQEQDWRLIFRSSIKMGLFRTFTQPDEVRTTEAHMDVRFKVKDWVLASLGRSANHERPPTCSSSHETRTARKPGTARRQPRHLGIGSWN